MTASAMRTKLAWIRTSRGLSQRQLAEKSGVELRAIAEYEQRRRRIDKASAEVVYMLATALECPMEALLEHK